MGSRNTACVCITTLVKSSHFSERRFATGTGERAHAGVVPIAPGLGEWRGRVLTLALRGVFYRDLITGPCD